MYARSPGSPCPARSRGSVVSSSRRRSPYSWLRDVTVHASRKSNRHSASTSARVSLRVRDGARRRSGRRARDDDLAAASRATTAILVVRDSRAFDSRVFDSRASDSRTARRSPAARQEDGVPFRVLVRIVRNSAFRECLVRKVCAKSVPAIMSDDQMVRIDLRL